MQRIASLVDAAKVSQLIDEESFSLQDVADAHAKLEAGRAIGKFVIVIDTTERGTPTVQLTKGATGIPVGAY